MAVRKAKRGSAPGPSGWRYEHIKAICEHAEGTSVVHVVLGRMVASSLSSEVRAAGANAYATTKDRRANKIIEDKSLNIGFRAITFGTYGAFGKSTHKLIATATANSPQPLFSPWVKPGPKAHAYLLFGFTLARANARMLINAEAKRRSARNSVRASRPQCTSAVAVIG